MATPEYGNWVSKRVILRPAAAAAILGALAFLLPILAVPAVILLLVAAYFLYARQKFSPVGGNLQSKIHNLLLDHFAWNGAGTVLDIGCGSGALTIMLAKKYASARVTGIDSWGPHWEYSKDVCERNSVLEGTRERVLFRQASASSLPFEEGSFDAAVSNLAFHEVDEMPDKKALIAEALRVVKKGGVFAFQDLFLWRRVFGPVDDLIASIRATGIDQVEFIDTSRAEFIPAALRLPFMVGTIGILRGKK